MKKAISLILTLLLLLNLSSVCHATLQISANHGNPILSWDTTYHGPLVGMSGYLEVQSANSLSLPTTWNPLNLDFGPGNMYLQPTNQQQFFRISPVVPLFEFAIFYNLNMETTIASTTLIAGPVFCNKSMWTGSSALTFDSLVLTVGTESNGVNDPFCPGYTGSGKSTFSLPGQPTTGNAPLSLVSNGTNWSPSAARALVNLPPANFAIGSSSAYTLAGLAYFANEADLFLTNTATGTNWAAFTPKGTNLFLYYQDAFNAPNYLTWVTNDYYLLKTVNSLMPVSPTNYVPPTQYTNIQYAGYSFITNALFYDWREGWHEGSGPPKAVQAVQIDFGKFNLWLTNRAVNGGNLYNSESESDKGHPIDSIYVYNSVTLTSTTLPAVRIVNGGGVIPNDFMYGFTLVTPMPLYVWGDYNISNFFGSSISQNSTTFTQHSALIADAITILSDGWSDPGLNKVTAGPTAASTTVNAAVVTGIVESTNNPASDADGYSGGVENFYRLLENWSAKNLTFNGSIVVLYPSQYATNCWQQTGGYYAAATRHWAYDTNFSNLTGLPPLTPQVGNFITP